jgi:DNA-directed RNA polymerase specialized sigma24 family protein
MISDAIEHALVAVDKFDPNKSSNPFSYITTMVYRSFIRRIAKEKRQSYIRSKLIQDMPIDSFDIQDHDDDNDFMNNYMAFIQSHQNFDDTQEKKAPKQRAIQRGPLEDFLVGYISDISSEDTIDLEKIALELEKEVNETI